MEKNENKNTMVNKIALSVYVQAGDDVPTVKTLKEFIDILSLLGYKKWYLGIGDNFEVKNQPYFAYMRGRYKAEELIEIKKYADGKGIETVPAIQTLGHFSAIPVYTRYQPIIDHDDVLLIDEEETYSFLEDIISTCADIFGKGHLMIGGDEAHMLGAGKYYDRHGNYDRTEIFIRHLLKVIEIATKYGMSCEMWSDMFFKLDGTEDYFNGKFSAPKKLIDLVPKDITIIHWYYDINSVEEHAKVLKEHKRLTDRVMMAGAFRKFQGFAPNNTYSIEANRNIITACRQENISEVMFAMWDNNGGEASIFSILPALFDAAVENGNVTIESADKLFYELTGMSQEEFMLLDYLNFPYFQKVNSGTCSFIYLYADPLLSLTNTLVTENIGQAFADYAKKIKKFRKGKYGYIFDVNYRLALVLEKKAHLSIDIKNYYHEKDYDALRNIAQNVIPETLTRIDAFFNAFDVKWKKENMSVGFEIHCARIGALRFRLEYVAKYLLDYCDGKIKEIRELDDPTLPYDFIWGGKTEDTCWAPCWNYIITAGNNW